MDPIREIQKVKSELEQKQGALAIQLRSEFNRFNSETKTILNSIDDKIAERVQEEVSAAMTQIQLMLSNLKMRLGASNGNA